MKSVLSLLFAGLLSSAGCQRSDGEKLGRIGNRVLQEVRGLAPEEMPWHPVPVVRRVQERLTSDRHLAGLNFEVVAVEQGVRLRGKVPDETARQRACELAESTSGVEKVVDELSVEP